jgi:hypothetical protein
VDAADLELGGDRSSPRGIASGDGDDVAVP